MLTGLNPRPIHGNVHATFAVQVLSAFSIDVYQKIDEEATVNGCPEWDPHFATGKWNSWASPWIHSWKPN